MNLVKTLNDMQAKLEISNEAMAKQIGVSVISLRGVRSGAIRPNKITATKYADFLGFPIGEILSDATLGTRQTKRKPSTRLEKVITKQRLFNAQGAEFLRQANIAARLLNDPLALAIQRAGRSKRRLIASLLGV